MGKAKAGKKVFQSLSKVVKGLDRADAEKVLAKIDTPEKAVALTGDARAEYLKALDTVYGPKDTRMKDMGFGEQDWYHGTSEDFPEFLREKLRPGETRNQIWTSSNPEVASGFAKAAGHNKAHAEWQSSYVKHKEFFDKIQKTYPKWNGRNIPERIINFDEKIGDISKTEADLLRKYQKNLDNLNESVLFKNTQIGSGENILPLKVRRNTDKNLDFNGSNWSDVKDKIGNDEILLKNIQEDIRPHEVPVGDSLGVLNPNQIRSKFAAFDPRFKNSPLLMAGAAGVAINMLPEESEASMGKFNSLKKMWQVGDKAFPAANAAEALKVQKAMETKGMVPHGKVLVEAKGTVPVANKPISNMARGIAVPGALGIDSTGSDVLKSGMQGVLDAFGAYRQNIVEPVANKLKETLTPKLNIQGQQYDTASPVSDMALDIAADPLTYAGGGAGAGLGALDMATSFGEESPKRNYEGLKSILNKK